MMRQIAGLALGLALPVVVAAAADQTADTGKGLTNPFFPYSVGGVSDDVLREMGYTPMRYLYVGVNLDKSPLYAPHLKDQIRGIKGTNTLFWLCVGGRKDKDNARDEQAVAVIRELAAVADEVGVRMATRTENHNSSLHQRAK